MTLRTGIHSKAHPVVAKEWGKELQRMVRTRGQKAEILKDYGKDGMMRDDGKHPERKETVKSTENRRQHRLCSHYFFILVFKRK